MNPPGICDIEQLERDICKTPSFGRNSRARPNYCHRTSLINTLQRPEIRGGLSTPGRILCEINQQFVKPNYFGLEKWRGTSDHSTLLPRILLSGEGELGGWECCWCPARSLDQEDLAVLQGWDGAPALWSLLLPFSRQTWEAVSLSLVILANLGILTHRAGCAWVCNSVLGMEKEFLPNICLFLRSGCDNDVCASSGLKVLPNIPNSCLDVSI